MDTPSVPLRTPNGLFPRSQCSREQQVRSQGVCVDRRFRAHLLELLVPAGHQQALQMPLLRIPHGVVDGLRAGVVGAGRSLAQSTLLARASK